MRLNKNYYSVGANQLENVLREILCFFVSRKVLQASILNSVQSSIFINDLDGGRLYT